MIIIITSWITHPGPGVSLNTSRTASLTLLDLPHASKESFNETERRREKPWKIHQVCINFLSWANFHSIALEQKQKRSHWQEFVIQVEKSSGVLSSQWPFSSCLAVTALSFVWAEAFCGKWSRQPRVEEELFSLRESSLSGQSLTVGGKALYLFICLFIYCIIQTFSLDVQTPHLEAQERKRTFSSSKLFTNLTVLLTSWAKISVKKLRGVRLYAQKGENLTTNMTWTVQHIRSMELVKLFNCISFTLNYLNFNYSLLLHIWWRRVQRHKSVLVQKRENVDWISADTVCRFHFLFK